MRSLSFTDNTDAGETEEETFEAPLPLLPAEVGAVEDAPPPMST